MANKFNFGEVKKRLEQAKKAIPQALASETQNAFVKNFDNGGFFGDKWSEVQRRIPDTKAYKYPAKRGLSRRTKPILTMSGRLRRAVATMKRTAKIDSTSITMVVDVPYAKIQNEGGTINKKESKKVLHFKADLYDLQGNVKRGKFSRKKDATHAQLVDITAHDIEIPERKFIGQHPKLTAIQKQTIQTVVDKIWR